jgi:hypothetical protein
MIIEYSTLISAFVIVFGLIMTNRTSFKDEGRNCDREDEGRGPLGQASVERSSETHLDRSWSGFQLFKSNDWELSAKLEMAIQNKVKYNPRVSYVSLEPWAIEGSEQEIFWKFNR